MDQSILSSLKSAIENASLDGFIIPSNDEFQNEYVPDHLNRLRYATGFTGSNGVAIITLKKSAFFTDGRYLLQASKQLSKEFTILDVGEKSSCDWFDLGLEKGAVLGYDPMLHTKDNLAYYGKLSSKYGFVLKPVANIVDQIWSRKEEQIKAAFELNIKYSGKDYLVKFQEVIAKIEDKATHLLLTNSDEVCWLLNIRGADTPYTPFLLSFALLSRNGALQLFTDPRKVKFTQKNVEVLGLEKIEYILKNAACVQVDNAKTPVKFLQILEGRALSAKSPVEQLKACKNPVEVDGFRKAHKLDGIALTKFIKWLEGQEQINEVQAAEKLLELRQESDLFVYPSFATISAYGANGSIIHYKPSSEQNAQIGKDNFYLLDSGGQYYCGTTDVTRTLHLGKPTAEQKRLFTLVLKGHIDLAKAKFSKGTTGVHLDALARAPLWQEGLDFAHSTGHGVGHFLSVHEGPQRIGKGLSGAVALEPGMIVSNEPGYYEDGKFGIRIESLMLVKESTHKNFLEFETLTMVPIQENLIDYGMLDNAQLEWLKNYHTTVEKLV
ncbi:MAG: putative peptidase [Candidatus Midichloriaceae bacterium]|jgi:Xaa-Pro aminopeptidase|nr:putative peptidase [Candidatus Midichloriaceae bacterium]